MDQLWLMPMPPASMVPVIRTVVTLCSMLPQRLRTTPPLTPMPRSRLTDPVIPTRELVPSTERKSRSSTIWLPLSLTF